MKVPHQVPTPVNRLALGGKLTGRLLGWALALGALPAAAQQVPRPGQALPEDTVRQVVDLPAATIDSLAAEPLEIEIDSARWAWLHTPATLQELVGDRMSCFETAAPHQFNNAVMAYVRLFTERQRGYTQRVLERRDFYFPIFEKYLAKYNLPDELKYLSVVESALIPTAKSQVGAVGLWQFMPPTASDMRLKRDEWVDERMHPEKSTEAACKYLRDLHRMFHDWELVLAAYNWGAGNVQRVIKRTGKRSFWEMYPHMPAETRNYVPTFTAIMYAMTYAKEHDLPNPALRYQQYEPLDTLTLRGQAIDLRRLSRALGYADSLALTRYNPELRRPSLPAGYRPYVLRFPAAARVHLGEVNYATLVAYCQPAADLPQLMAALPPRLAGVEPWPDATQVAATKALAADSTPRYRRMSYTLRKGQTLATVAEKYEVSQTQLRKWNNLRKGQPLKPGKQLLVLVALPAAPAPRLSQPAAPTPPPTTVATLRRAAPVDTAWQELVAANARYAREAQERTAREAAQAKELARVQRQIAARAAAQKRLSIAQAAAAAKATAAARLGMPTDSADATTANVAAASVAPVATSAASIRESKRRPASSAATARQAENRVALVAKAAQVAAEPEKVETAAEETVPTRRPARPAAAATAVEARPAGRPQSELRPAKEETATLYTVRPGDNLTKLAREQGVPLEQLKAWNKINGETVLVGQQLRLTAPADATAVPAATTAPEPRRAAAKKLADSPQLATHIVQPGDTLFSIARRFGMSLAELKRLNHLASDQVKLGQKLVVGG